MIGSKSNRIGWFFWLKLALMLFSIYFIYYHIREESFLQYVLLLREEFAVSTKVRLYIYMVGVLMLLNWYLESVKWKFLTAVFYRQTIFSAVRAVLSGLAISILTPNRSGDFAGRIMHLPSEKRIEGTVFSVIGSFAQFLITILTGCISLFLLKGNILTLPEPYFYIVLLLSAILLGGMHYLFFNMCKYWHKLSTFKKLEKYADIINDTSKLSTLFLLRVYGLTFLRYAVFSIQFCLLLVAFQVQLPFLVSLGLVMISFLFITTIPSFAISEIGIRGSICIFFFSNYTDQLTGVLIASTALWLINVAAPAIAGALSMLYFKKGR